MKPEIEKILEMHKAGTITSEQASQLIEELNVELGEEDHRTDEKNKKTASEKSLGEKIYDQVNHLIEGFQEQHRSHHAHHVRNHWHGSHVEPPKGKNFVFERNNIMGAHLQDLSLFDSEFTDNKIRGCHFQDAKFSNSRMNESSFMHCHIQDLSLDHAEIGKVQVSNAHLKDLQLHTESSITSLEIKASHLSDLILADESTLTNSKLFASALHDVELKRSEFENVELMAVAIKGLKFFHSSWMDVVCKKIKFKDFTMTESHFTEVFFTAEHKWKRSGFKSTRFENCYLKKTLFSNCRFNDVVIKNITLENIQVRDLALSDITVDGNDAFLALLTKGN